jgi:hypothetical protein
MGYGFGTSGKLDKPDYRSETAFDYPADTAELIGLHKLAVGAADTLEIAREAIRLAESLAVYRHPMYVKETLGRLQALRDQLG